MQQSATLAERVAELQAQQAGHAQQVQKFWAAAVTLLRPLEACREGDGVSMCRADLCSQACGRRCRSGCCRLGAEDAGGARPAPHGGKP